MQTFAALVTLSVHKTNTKFLLRVLAAILFFASTHTSAQWTWNSSLSDERALYEQHMAEIEKAYEVINTLSRINGELSQKVDKKQLIASVNTVNALQNNKVVLGDENQYQGRLERVKSKLVDRFDRFKYQIETQIKNGDKSSKDNLRFIIKHDYFALPILLKVDNLSKYQALEKEVLKHI